MDHKIMSIPNQIDAIATNNSYKRESLTHLIKPASNMTGWDCFVLFFFFIPLLFFFVLNHIYRHQRRRRIFCWVQRKSKHFPERFFPLDIVQKVCLIAFLFLRSFVEFLNRIKMKMKYQQQTVSKVLPLSIFLSFSVFSFPLYIH